MATAALEPSERLGERLPRVLFAGGTAYDLPLAPGVARKWDRLSERMEVRVVARAGTVEASDDRFHLLSPRGHGGAFHLRLARALAGETADFQPDVVIAQSPYDAVAVLASRRMGRARPRLVAEVHGDWRTATRMYGSPVRRAYARLADRAAAAALRRADATRSLSPFTASLVEDATGRPPLASFPTYTALESFTSGPHRPLPPTPTAVWIGVLERYKAPDVLADAWRAVARELPHAQLVVVGDGPMRPVVEALRADLGERVRLIRRLAPHAVARVLDEGTLLALPSRLEGMGRVAIEALSRGRPVVGTTSGGIRDVVADGRTGLLVAPEEPDPFAEARPSCRRTPARTHRDSSSRPTAMPTPCATWSTARWRSSGRGPPSRPA